MLPPSLVGEAHRGGFICPDWELRVTKRCLRDDLGAEGSAFEDITGHEIIKALVKDRFNRTVDTRQVAPLTSRREVWVLSRGNDHRGGTWFDDAHHVVWLVAYRLHRSQVADDFFPYCKALDADEEMVPGHEDYKRLFEDRDHRFAAAIRIEAPLILRDAREQQAEQRCMLGGTQGACIAVELSDDLEATTIAFKVSTLPWEHVPLILAAFHPDADWEDAPAMPSRPLEADEVAFTHLHFRE